MGKKTGKKSSNSNSGGGGGGGFSTLDVDPRRVRYAHSKIKPLFSGCGRTIEQTLCEIRDGKTRVGDLPMITVLLGPLDPSDGDPWFFSLNNRRLFVFKACHEEGLLGPSGLVRVRARAMKAHELERYTLERCSVQAKFLFTPKPPPPPVATAPALLSPTRATSTGMVVEAGTSSAAAGRQDTPEEEKEGKKEEGEGLGSCSAKVSGEVHVARQTRQVEGLTEEEQGEGGRGGRGVFDSRALRREIEDERNGGADDEEEEDHGRYTRCPRSSRDGDRRAAGGATREIATAVDASAGGKKSGRRKGKGKGGAEMEGAGLSLSDEVEGIARDGGVEGVPLSLSRKQERARNGRRQRRS